MGRCVASKEAHSSSSVFNSFPLAEILVRALTSELLNLKEYIDETSQMSSSNGNNVTNKEDHSSCLDAYIFALTPLL